MGLVQNLIERAGIATVSLTTAPTVTFGVGVPRALYVRFPYGNPFGEPGSVDLQKQILIAALNWLYDADRPNRAVKLSVSWRRSTRR